MFGGPQGLEYALQADPQLAAQHSCPSELFDRCAVLGQEHPLAMHGSAVGLPPLVQAVALARTPARANPPLRLRGPPPRRYLNTCFDQGSRTIRSEEAVLISLAFLQPAIAAATGQR